MGLSTSWAIKSSAFNRTNEAAGELENRLCGTETDVMVKH